MALLRIRNTPQTLELSPYEMWYGHQFLTNDFLLDREILEQVKDLTDLAKFQQTLQQLHEHVPKTLAINSLIRDLILVKSSLSLKPSLDPTRNGP
jgi:hypothetical protein